MSRTPVATVAGLVFVAVYVAAALGLPEFLPPLPWPVQAAYWCVAGLLWVLPIWWLMLWGAGKR